MNIQKILLSSLRQQLKEERAGIEVSGAPSQRLNLLVPQRKPETTEDIANESDSSTGSDDDFAEEGPIVEQETAITELDFEESTKHHKLPFRIPLHY